MNYDSLCTYDSEIAAGNIIVASTWYHWYRFIRVFAALEHDIFFTFISCNIVVWGMLLESTIHSIIISKI